MHTCGNSKLSSYSDKQTHTHTLAVLLSFKFIYFTVPTDPTHLMVYLRSR